MINTYAESFSLIVKSTNVNVRAGAGTNYPILGKVSAGYRIQSTGTAKDSTGKTWYRFMYANNNAYIREDFLKQSKTYVFDQAFENELSRQAFPEDYKILLRQLHADYPSFVFTKQSIDMDFSYAVEQELQGHKTLVTKGAISSYKSTDEGNYDYTTSTWQTYDGNSWVAASREIIAYQMDPRNALFDPYIFQFEEQRYNSNFQTLVGVTEMVKGTFLDGKITTTEIPSNSNSIIPIITYDGSVSNDANNFNNSSSTNSNNFYVPSVGPGIDSSNQNLPTTINNDSNYGPGVADFSGFATPILSNNISKNQVMAFSNVVVMPSITIHNNDIIDENSSYNYTYLPAGNYTYAEIIYNACAQIGINPYVVVAMILQEQGLDGKSDSISGKNAKYPNIYNYGNVGAYANTAAGLSAIENGLLFASTEGSYNRSWNSKEKALYGIVDYYANSFIKKGQDTFYLKKWNVQGNNPFTHQYMTNVFGASSEAVFLSTAYNEQLRAMPHEFKIVCYNNMPLEPSPLPTRDGSPNNKLKSLTVDNCTLTPAFHADINNYSMVVPAELNTINIKAVAYDQKAKITGTGNVAIANASSIVSVNVVAQSGDIRQYSIYVYRAGMENNPLIPNQLVVPIINNDTIQDNNFIPPVINTSIVYGGPGM